MDLIDDRGRLLGLLNVIDALVLLLVAAVVVAGVALVTQPDPQPAPEPPETTTEAVTLLMTNVPPYLSEAIREGMTETVDGQTVATITDVNRTPSTMIVTDREGEVHVREHPAREDLRLTAELDVRETPDGIVFKDQPIQIGSTVSLDLGTVTIETTVTSL